MSTTSTAETVGNKALSAIPGVGPILGTIAGFVENIFGAAHAAAVQKQAQIINKSLPGFLQTVQAIMAAAENDDISEAQAVAALAQAQADYESATASIRKQSGTCIPGCSFNPDGSTSSSGNYCSTGGTCNAACGTRCSLVEPTVQHLTAILKAGGGSYTIPPFNPKDQTLGSTPAIQITYSAPSILRRIEHGILGFVEGL